jgi:hypothetical protein
MTAIWKMPVTLRNRLGMGRRQSAPDDLASSECDPASRLALSGIVLSREISPVASSSRRRRAAPISCRRKTATAMRNATHTRSGGVSTVRSFSTGAHPLRLMLSLVALCPCPWPLAGHGGLVRRALGLAPARGRRRLLLLGILADRTSAPLAGPGATGGCAPARGRQAP